MDSPVLRAAPDLQESSDLPAHARIEGWLERLITRRELQVGDRLPAEVEIASGLGVSRMTLRQALSSLEAKGFLVRKRGRWGGSFVAEPRLQFELSGLPGFTEQMRRLHVRAGAEVLRASTGRAAPSVLEALQLKRGGHVHEVARIRSADGEPIALEESYFPAAVFVDLLEHELTGSLYELMEEVYGRPPHSAVEVLDPILATDDQAKLLDVEPGAPLMQVTRTAYAVDGLPVEFACDLFRTDRTRITLHTEVDKAPVAQVRTDPTS